MRSFYTLFLVASLCVLSSFFQPLAANNATYEQRRLAYIDSALAHFIGDDITLQAYKGVPVDTAALNSLCRGILGGLNSDFDIIKLIRVLYFTNGQYDTTILPAINSVPYWLRANETKRTYWSENHMVMWMGSDWLLHEKYGRAIDSTLDKRLRHYLRLKNEYGFYEFFSSVYSPYCLAGLLNLADFSQDLEIKTLATQAAQKLMAEMLMLTSDQGVFYPAAGRNYYGKYLTPYGQNHNNLIYLLEGFGPMQYGSHAGGFLASSTVPVDTVINSWVPAMDTLFHVGHTLDSGFVINSDIIGMDKTIFQWSSGAYFHPEVALETATLLTDSNLWHHVDFAAFSGLSGVSLSSVPALATSLSCLSESSVICGEDIAIFKHKSITLSSIQDFWKGKIGYQEMPCVGTVGTTPVFTGSGPVITPWDNRNADNANEDLPYVKQKKNLALLMYRPEPVPAFLNYTHKQVSLYFNDPDFNEVRNDSMWLLGRQGNNYVAVRRSCTDTINGIRACDIPNGQSWVIMVGDSDMYGSFNNFQSVIDQSQFTERWYYDSLTLQEVYYAKIIMDTTIIEYAWGVDSVATGINKLSANNGLKVFPNPANDQVTIDLSAFAEQSISIKVTNMIGEVMYSDKTAAITENKTINIGAWAEGIYLIQVQNGQQLYTQKLVKK
ncbi:MAG: hypothetical protein JWO06_312 [Bacteroidota bacterium]|nr:hypothetical protein [Bacteroidota bacterium]